MLTRQEKETLCHCWWECDQYNHCGNQHGDVSKSRIRNSTGPSSSPARCLPLRAYDHTIAVHIRNLARTAVSLVEAEAGLHCAGPPQFWGPGVAFGHSRAIHLCEGGGWLARRCCSQVPGLSCLSPQQGEQGKQSGWDSKAGPWAQRGFPHWRRDCDSQWGHADYFLSRSVTISPGVCASQLRALWLLSLNKVLEKTSY